VLLSGRAVQAFGAGGILPVASAVIADVFPAEQRGRALGAIGAVFGIAFVLGPVLGGVLLPLGWPALFLVNIPIGIVLMVAAWRNLPDMGSQRNTPFDVRGAVLLTTTLICCALALTRVEELWTQFSAGGKFVLLYLLAGGACGLLLWRVERAVEDPILPPALFGSKQLRLIGMIAIATGLVEACMIFLPAVAVSQFAVSEASASFMLLPLVASLIVGSPLAGYGVDRFGVKPIIQTGLCLVVAGLLAYALLTLSKVNFYAAGACIGLGLSSLLGAPLRYATLAEVGKENRGLSQGLLSLSLSCGQIIGASAIGGLIASQMNAALGFQNAMLIVAICVALATLLSFALRPSGGPKSAL
jgi:MFS family permease